MLLNMICPRDSSYCICLARDITGASLGNPTGPHQHSGDWLESTAFHAQPGLQVGDDDLPTWAFQA